MTYTDVDYIIDVLSDIVCFSCGYTGENIGSTKTYTSGKENTQYQKIMCETCFLERMERCLAIKSYESCDLYIFRSTEKKHIVFYWLRVKR